MPDDDPDGKVEADCTCADQIEHPALHTMVVHQEMKARVQYKQLTERVASPAAQSHQGVQWPIARRSRHQVFQCDTNGVDETADDADHKTPEVEALALLEDAENLK